MKELRDAIVTWVDLRMEDMLSAPRMWGSNESIELQLLLLLEIRALALRPEEIAAEPRCIIDAYGAYLSKTYPSMPNRPLNQIVEQDHLGLVLAAELRKFRNQMVKQYGTKKPAQPGSTKTVKKVLPRSPWFAATTISRSLPAPPRNASNAAGGRL